MGAKVTLGSVAVGAAGIFAVMAVGTACSNDPGGYKNQRGIADAKITATPQPGNPRVVNNADHYPNVSTMCDGKYGYMLFTVTHDTNDVPPVVVPDPRCPGWIPGLVGGQPTVGGAAPQSDENK